MYPVIFAVGPVALYSYGLALFIAFFASLFVIWKRGKEMHFDEDELFDVVFIILLCMLAGARLGYVGLHFEDFGLNVFSWFNLIGKPGLWFFSGLLAGGLAVWWQAKKRRWDLFTVSDVLVVGLAIAQAILALGSFLNGSGYGIATTLFIGISFPGLYDKRIPVQLFELITYTALFAWLWVVEGSYRTYVWYKGNKSEASSGFITAMYLMVAGFFWILVWVDETSAIDILGNPFGFIALCVYVFFGNRVADTTLRITMG